MGDKKFEEYLEEEKGKIISDIKFSDGTVMEPKESEDGDLLMPFLVHKPGTGGNEYSGYYMRISKGLLRGIVKDEKAESGD